MRLPAHQDEPGVPLARVLDAIEDGIIVYDAAGRPTHLNAAMRALLAEDSERCRLEAALEEVRRALSGSNARSDATGGATNGATAPVVSVVLRTGAAEYRLRAAIVTPESRVDAHTGVVVSVKASAEAQYLSAAALKQRYGLTSTEARVAALVEAQLPSREIALALEISLHTARRHVEAVLRKLGIHSRSDVHRKLTGG